MGQRLVHQFLYRIQSIQNYRFKSIYSKLSIQINLFKTIDSNQSIQNKV